MGELMVERGEKTKALEYFKKALNALARPGCEHADTGRKAETQDAIKKIEKK